VRTSSCIIFCSQDHTIVGQAARCQVKGVETGIRYSIQVLLCAKFSYYVWSFLLIALTTRVRQLVWSTHVKVMDVC